MAKESKDEQLILEILKHQHCTRAEIGRKHWKDWEKGTHKSQLKRILDHLSKIGKIEMDAKEKWMRSTNPNETRLKNEIVHAIKDLRPVNHVSFFKTDVPMFFFGTTNWDRIEKAELAHIHARKPLPSPEALYRADLYRRLFRESFERFLYELESIIDNLAHKHGEKAKDQTLFVLARFLWVSHLWQKKEIEDMITQFGPPDDKINQVWQEYCSLKNLRELLDFTKRTDWMMDTFQFLKDRRNPLSEAKVDMPTYKWHLFDSTLFRLDLSNSSIFKPEDIAGSLDENIAFLSQPDNLKLLNKFMKRVSQIRFMLLVSIGIDAIDERPDELIERFDKWMKELKEGKRDTEDFIFIKGIRNLQDFMCELKKTNEGKPKSVKEYIETCSHMPWGRTLFTDENDYKKFRSKLAVDEIESWDLQYLYERHVNGTKISFYKHILETIKDRSRKRRQTWQWQMVQESKKRELEGRSSEGKLNND